MYALGLMMDDDLDYILMYVMHVLYVCSKCMMDDDLDYILMCTMLVLCICS